MTGPLIYGFSIDAVAAAAEVWLTSLRKPTTSW
jgi:hypothetical protein